jgi:transposase
MDKSPTRAPRTWREGRRLRGWELLEAGWKVGEVAAALGVTHGAVSQWRKRAQDGGRPALYERKPPGQPARLTGKQQARIPELLRRGAEAWGFRGGRWTRDRVAAVIQREFGVQYHPAHISRLLARLGWTLQKPARRARQRDEAAVAQWRQETTPALGKRGPSAPRPRCS